MRQNMTRSIVKALKPTCSSEYRSRSCFRTGRLADNSPWSRASCLPAATEAYMCTTAKTKRCTCSKALWR